MPKLAGARSPKANKGSEDEGGAGSAAATALAGAEATEHRCSIRRPHHHPPGEQAQVLIKVRNRDLIQNTFELCPTNTAQNRNRNPRQTQPPQGFARVRWGRSFANTN